MNDWSDAERCVEKAQQFFEQRKWSEALREIRTATSINPYNASWFFNTGLILDEMGWYDEALEAYRQADSIEANDVHTLNHLGVDLYRTGRFDKAIETFQKIESIDSTFEPSYCNRVIIYAHLNQHELAEEMFYTARLYKEDCPHCFYNICCSLEARGQYDKAIYCWTRSLDLQGQQGDIHARIAHAYWKKGDLEQARRHFLSNLRLNPGRTQALLDLGELLIEMGRHGEAGEKFRRAIELSPHHPGGHYCHGRLLLMARRDDEATGAFSAVLQLDPTFAGAHLALGRIALRRGDLPGARLQLQAEMQLRPDDPKLLLEMANLMMDVGESRSAMICLKGLTNREPERVSVWLNLAVAQFSRGNYQEGIASCLTALAKDPNNIIAMYNMALAHEHLKQYETAINWVRQARKIDVADVSLQRLEVRLRLLWVKDSILEFIRRKVNWTRCRRNG